MAIGRIPEPGTGIPESIIAAKGDLLTGTANDTPAVLSVGANGTTLVADSGEATGLKWQAASGGNKTLSVISSGSMPAASTLSITGLTADYYMLRLSSLTWATGITSLFLRFNSNTSSVYNHTGWQGSTMDNVGYVNNPAFYLSLGDIFNTGGANSFMIEIKNSKEAGFHTASWVGWHRNQANSAIFGVVQQGYFEDATTISSIQIVNAAGYNFNGGTYELIGG